MPFRSSSRGAYGPQGPKVLRGPLAPVWVTTGSVANQNIGTSLSVQLNSTDDSGVAPTYSLASGTLPSGITLSSSGLLSGTIGGTAGTFNFTVRSTDENDRFTDSGTLSITTVISVTTVTSTFSVPSGITPVYNPLSESNLIAGESFSRGSATSISLTRADGFRYFTFSAGSYTVTISGACGSGNFHYRGRVLQGTLTLTSTTNLMAVVGHNGVGAYSGGGMTGLAIGTNFATATPIFVAGGGAGGYGSAHSVGDGRPTNSFATYSTGGFYDPGAGWFSNAGSGNATTPARSITNGGFGGIGGCADGAGFGGGGGGCPGGGGGYQGGQAGGNTPAQTGGTGGTSFWTSPMSSISDQGLRGSDTTTNFSSTNTSNSGFMTITSNN